MSAHLVMLVEAVALAFVLLLWDTERRRRQPLRLTYLAMLQANLRLQAAYRRIVDDPEARIDQLMDELDEWRSRESRA